MAKIDPFLHDWDEKYHALVAKNMISFPLKPMIYITPIGEYNMESWCCNHVWLHKQPLFLWQMALSMKLFGVSEFTMRLPSILLGSFCILLIYRIALLSTSNKLVSCIAALLLCFSHYQLELISGRYGMDHNDISFSFYILSSIWAYFEYQKSPKWCWIVAIGVFSGGAILNKWLTGLLVFLVWGILIVVRKNADRKKEIIHFAISLIICTIVFLPWQLFILNQYPAEANYEYALNAKHIWESVEGHKGDYWYYYRNFDAYFGQTNSFLIAVGLILLLLKYPEKRYYSLCLIILFVFIFCFFSFFVSTKIMAFFFIVAPFGMIFIAIALKEIIALFRYHKAVIIILVGFSIFQSLNPLEIYNFRKNNRERDRVIYNTKIYKNLKNQLPADVKIVVNLPEFEFPDVMFYNKDITAMHYCPSEQDSKIMMENQVPIAGFKSHKNYLLALHLQKYQHFYLIDTVLKDR